MKNKRMLIVLAIVTSLSLVACGGGGGADSSYMVTEEAASYDGGGFDSALDNFVSDFSEDTLEYNKTSSGANDSYTYNDDENDSSDFENDYYTSERKIVYTSDISIETKKFDEDISSIKELVTSNGGYLENTSSNGTAEYGNRYASMTARIPSENYKAFMESVGSIGSVTSTSEYVDDITSDYVDVQARLKSLNTKLLRLQELEQQATTVEDLLDIEDRINETQYQIENYTAQLKLFDDKVSLCTVSIYLDEVATYSEVKADTFTNRVVEAFSGSLAAFLTVLQGLVIMIIYALPYLIVAAIVLLIIYFATKKARLEYKNKKKTIQNNPSIKSNISTNAGSSYKGPSYTMSNTDTGDANQDPLTGNQTDSNKDK